MVVIKLSKSLWGEILKTVAYFKIFSPSWKDVTPYERLNEEKLNLKHLQTINSWAWVYIPRKLRKKLLNRA